METCEPSIGKHFTYVLGVDNDGQFEIELIIQLHFFILEDDQKRFAHSPIVEDTRRIERIVGII